MTKLINKEEELKKAKEQEIRLKDELAKTKAENKDKLKELEMRIATEQLKNEKVMNEKEHKHQMEMMSLKFESMTQKRKYEDEQKRFKQQEELKQTQHEKYVQELEAKHQKEINDIKEITNDMARKSDIENLQFNAAEQVADATLNKTKAFIQNELQEKIQPLQEATNQANRTMELAKTVYEGTEKIKDAMKNEMISEFKAATQPTLQQLESRNQELKRNMEVLDAKAKAINDVKQAKLELDKAQIQSISQAVIEPMNARLQEMKGEIALNKDIYDEIKKQNEIKIQIAQANQTLDEKTRNEYYEKVKAEKMKTHELEMTNALSNNLHQVHMENEATKSKIVNNVAGIIPNFKVEDMNKPGFNDMITQKRIEISKEHTERAKQLEESERLLNEQRKLDELKIKQAEMEGKLQVNYSSKNPEYYARIQEVSKRKTEIQQETDHFNKLNEELAADNERKRAAIDSFYENAFTYMNECPSVKVRAEQIANRKHGNKHGVMTPEIIKQAIDEEESAATKEMEHFNNTPEIIKKYNEIKQAFDLNDTVERLQQEKEDLQQQLFESQNRRRQAGNLILHMKQSIAGNNEQEFYGYVPKWNHDEVDKVITDAQEMNPLPD